MKKLIMIMFIMVLSFSLISCKKPDGTNNNNNNNNQQDTGDGVGSNESIWS